MQCSSCLSGKSKSFVLILICIILSIIFSGCTKSVRKVNYVTDDSAALQALSAKDDIAPLQSKSAQDLVTAGFLYLANKNLKIAELHFVTAIGKDPKMVDAFIGLGRIELLRSNYSSALVAFGKARALKPDSVPALVGEAQALRFEDKLNAAIEKINAAMMIAPEDISVLKELAMIYDLMGKETLSAPLYLEIVERSPDQAQSHNNLGLNLMMRGMYPEAILSFSQAHKLDRDNLRIKNNLASAYLLNGNEVNAINLFKGTVGEAAAYNNIGYLYMTQGHFDEAEQALNKALQLNPRHYVRAQENLETLQEMRRAERPSRL
ncbi:MAG: tetratricopeptide repeat protein [Desulfuromonadales bacterium]|nr:tetratricopeptide repeat protein [Desulfuromonadales bacterium]